MLVNSALFSRTAVPYCSLTRSLARCFFIFESITILTSSHKRDTLNRDPTSRINKNPRKTSNNLGKLKILCSRTFPVNRGRPVVGRRVL